MSDSDSTSAGGIAERTLTIRSASGDALLSVPAIPAGLGLVAAIAMAPRLVAAAALGGMFAKVSLSIE